MGCLGPGCLGPVLGVRSASDEGACPLWLPAVALVLGLLRTSLYVIFLGQVIPLLVDFCPYVIYVMLCCMLSPSLSSPSSYPVC